MTLNLAAVGKQIREMAENLASTDRRTEDKLHDAVEQLRSLSDDFHELRGRVENSKTGWPMARPLESPRFVGRLPDIPSSYTVVASDGSHIEPDRHGPALCYLINTGSAVLTYGPDSRAVLESDPSLGFTQEDLYVTHENRAMLVEAHILEARRSIFETKKLVEKSRANAAFGLTIAIQDGTLALQTGEGYGEKYIKKELLKDFLACLDEMRRCDVPVCSYVSRPRSTDVVNMLRMVRCPHAVVDCETICPNVDKRKTMPCADLEGLFDGGVFGRLLSPGERSSMFLSSSSISKKEYKEHEICCFYLHVGREVARVEVPHWVTLNEGYVDLIHAILYDQAQRGDGYPRVLMEAHEKAVISSAERRQFEELLEGSIISRGVGFSPSEKQRSKRLRGL